MKETASETEKAISPSRADGSRRWLSVTLKIIVPLAVSVGLCWVLMRGIDFGQMMEIVRTQCDFRYIALMMAMSVLPMVFRAMRWGIQLRAIGVKAPLHILCYSIFGTYAVNIVFPRLGEVWRTGYIASRQHAPFPQIFGSMVADRLADTISVALIALLTLLVAFEPLADFVRTYPAAYSMIAAILTSPWFWLALAAAAAAAITLLRICHGKKATMVKRFIRGLWDGFAAIFHMKGKLPWLLLTVLIWGGYFAQLYVAFFAFPFTREMLQSHGVAVVLRAHEHIDGSAVKRRHRSLPGHNAVRPARFRPCGSPGHRYRRPDVHHRRSRIRQPADSLVDRHHGRARSAHLPPHSP